MVLPSGGPVCANVLDIIVLCIMCVAQLSISGMFLCQCRIGFEKSIGEQSKVYFSTWEYIDFPSSGQVARQLRLVKGFLGERKPDGFSQQLRIIVTGVYYKAKEMVLPSSGTVTRQQVIVKSVQSRQRGGPQCPVVAQQAQGGTVGGVDQQQATLTPRHNATNHATKTKAQCHQQETLAPVAKS